MANRRARKQGFCSVSDIGDISDISDIGDISDSNLLLIPIFVARDDFQISYLTQDFIVYFSLLMPC